MARAYCNQKIRVVVALMRIKILLEIVTAMPQVKIGLMKTHQKATVIGQQVIMMRPSLLKSLTKRLKRALPVLNIVRASYLI